MLGMRTWARVFFFLGAGCGHALFAQQEPAVLIQPRERPRPVEAKTEPLLRIESSLVLIPVHVTNGVGRSVTGLKAENFQLFEDRAEQKVGAFFTDDAPVSIGFLFDTSGSMRTKMKKASEAAAAFFRTSNREDEFFLVEFNDKPRLIAPFTRDSDEVYQRISQARPAGRTTLIDAIHLALGEMRKARHARKALVILSDGGDNWSRRSAREVRASLIESDIQVYAMGVFDQDLAVKHPEEERNGPRLLDELTELTGGRHYPVASVDELPDIARRIGLQLRSQYLLGYYSSNAEKDGKYRQVVVRLATPDARDFRINYRRGYYAPADN